MIERLFVYGSLMPGQANAHVLETIEGEWQAASVRGTLVSAGWGAALGFPALKLDATGSDVKGLVFSSEHLAQHWARLDEFEGREYKRVATTATFDDQRSTQAYVYVIEANE